LETAADRCRPFIESAWSKLPSDVCRPVFLLASCGGNRNKIARTKNEIAHFLTVARVFTELSMFFEAKNKSTAAR
jgi:hypothetical protein